MNGLDDAPETIYRAVFLGVVFYFVLLLYAQMSGDQVAMYAAEFVFGVIAIGVGTILYVQTETGGRSAAILGAAASLVLGGMLQFAFLFTRIPTLDVASSLVVFVGIGLYIYTVWGAD